jgi:biopolymer transport protein TolR
MNRKPRKQRLVSEINITPFTDVILVLLVIFIIATPLIYQSNFKLNLPGAKNKESVTNTPKINISVATSGMIYLENKAVTMDELTEEIEARRAKDPDMHVLLHSDQATQFKYITKVLDLLNGLQIQNINVAVTPDR